MYATPKSEWRWAVGHIGLTILASNNYLIENMPWQSDQSVMRGWFVPHDDLTTFPAYARVPRMMDGTRKPDGFLKGQIGWKFFSEGQLAYTDTLFGWSDSVWSANATLNVRRATNAFVVLHCVLYRPIPNEDYKHGEYGVEDVVFRYENGVIVTA